MQVCRSQEIGRIALFLAFVLPCLSRHRGGTLRAGVFAGAVAACDPRSAHRAQDRETFGNSRRRRRALLARVWEKRSKGSEASDSEVDLPLELEAMQVASGIVQEKDQRQYTERLQSRRAGQERHQLGEDRSASAASG